MLTETLSCNDVGCMDVYLSELRQRSIANNMLINEHKTKEVVITLSHAFTIENLSDSERHTHNRFTALWILSRTTRVSQYQKKHSPTHTHRGHQSSLSVFSIYYDPWHPPCSIHFLYSLFPQSPSFVWSTSWPGILHFMLHTFLHPIIIFFSQHMPIPSQPVSL